VDLGRGDQAHDRPVHDQAGEHEQRQPVGLGAENLRSAEAVRHRAGGAPLGESRSRERHRQRRGVGEHVPGVREQRERGCQHAGDDLHDHEREDQRQRRLQRAPVGVAMYVRVVVRDARIVDPIRADAADQFIDGSAGMRARRA
jgi:hypothetical protein